MATPLPPPTLPEILTLTLSELTAPHPQTDPIHHAGRAALSLLPDTPDLARQLAYQKLHDVPYREVHTCWRRLYVEAALWVCVGVLRGVVDCLDGEEGEGKWVDQVVEMLDMALILTGAPHREEVVELWFAALEAWLYPRGYENDEKDNDNTEDDETNPRKRLKTHHHHSSHNLPTRLAPNPPPFPTLTHPIPVLSTPPALTAFTVHLRQATPTPLVLQNSISHWPALDTRPWSSPAYLLSRTLGGRRLVPVEVGRSYVDEGWGQRVMRFGDVIGLCVSGAGCGDGGEEQEGENGAMKEETIYLAQHALLSQIPSLRADVAIPDYCFISSCPSDPSSPSPSDPNPDPDPDTNPQLNAWLGPRSTISPLHTDPHHNILCQVAGWKYLRLYPPSCTPVLHPRSACDEHGVDMGNTSSVDLDEALAVASSGDAAAKAEFEARFPGFLGEEGYVECVLGPGECVFLPRGWWHYVRSLTESFSVSFWWD